MKWVAISEDGINYNVIEGYQPKLPDDWKFKETLAQGDLHRALKSVIMDYIISQGYDLDRDKSYIKNIFERAMIDIGFYS